MGKNDGEAVMVPLIVSDDWVVHNDSVGRWEHIAPDIKVDWVRMAESV